MTADQATFWNKIAPRYAKDPIADMKAYEYTLGRTLSYLSPDDHVLEIGAGTGSTALLIAPHVASIIATDIAPAMVQIARDKAQADSVTNMDCRALSAEDAAKLPDPVDAVLAFNLFHLVPRFEDIVADIHSRLPAGGYFISKTPCLADPVIGWKRFAFRAVIPVMQWVGKAPHVRFFTQDHLERTLTTTGFDIVEAGNFPAMSRYIVARKR